MGTSRSPWTATVTACRVWARARQRRWTRSSPNVPQTVSTLLLSRCCHKPPSASGASLSRQILPANEHVLVVEPRGFEPLTSAVKRRLDGFPKVSRDCKTRLATRILAQNAFPHFSSHWLGLLHKHQWQLRRNTLWPVRPAAADRGDRNGKPGKPCERNAHGHAMSNSITIY